ncbi:MAG: CinA family protein [Mycobacteriaceae bacterium]
MDDPLLVGSAAVRLVSLLASRNQTVSTAESLTAGLLSATIAGVPGASKVLRGGLVVYATDLKSVLAGVDGAVLNKVGPVAAEIAIQLAQGARDRCGSTWGLSLTGVAGPTPQDGHDVGTVFLGIAGKNFCQSLELKLRGSRWDIRRACVERAITELYDVMNND